MIINLVNVFESLIRKHLVQSDIADSLFCELYL